MFLEVLKGIPLQVSLMLALKKADFFSITCPIHANNVKNIGSSLTKLLSIKDKVEKMKSTPNSVSRLEKKLRTL